MYMCTYVLFAGIGGRLGVGSSLGAYVRKITAMEKPENLDDPREAVLKYAKVHTPTITPYHVYCMYVQCVHRTAKVPSVLYVCTQCMKQICLYRTLFVCNCMDVAIGHFTVSTDCRGRSLLHCTGLQEVSLCMSCTYYDFCVGPHPAAHLVV